MSDKFVLTKDGFECYKWDGEAKSKHRLREENGEVVVYDRKTKEVLQRYPTMEEAESVYYIKKTKNFMLTELRSSLQIEKGVTVKDFIAAINQHEELYLILEMLFGLDWENIPTDRNLEVFREGKIQNGILNFTCGSREIGKDYPCGLLTESGILNLLLGETYDCLTSMGMACNQPCEYGMSLLEVLQALFDKHQRPTLYFRKEEGELKLTLPTGEEINSLDVLLSPVEILDDIAIVDLFNWVARNDNIKQFIASYSWCHPIDAFHKEANVVKPPKEDDSERVNRTNVCRFVEVGRYKSDQPFHITEWVDFRAYGDVSPQTRGFYEEQGKECPKEECYGVDYGPAYEYSHLPFTVDDQLEIQKLDLYTKKGNVKESGGVLAKVTTPITLLEMLDSIYWDISFHGDPESRDAFYGGLCEQVEEVKKLAEKDDSKTKYYSSVEEMLNDIDKEGYDSFAVKPTPPEEDEEL